MSHCKVTVIHPELTEQEREIRMKIIRKATVEFLCAVEREKAEKKGANTDGKNHIS